MNLLDVLALAAGSLARHRRRTFLSLLGMAIGVAAVVLLTSLGEGARTFVLQQFEGIGSNLLGVLPGKVETTGGMPGFGGVPNDLTLADAEAIKRRVPQVARVVPFVLGNEMVSHGDRSRRVLVLGATSDTQYTHKMVVRAGRHLPTGPWDRGAPSVVLGPKLATELFGEANPLGGQVRVGSWRMRVIGVLAGQGNHLGFNFDEIALVPVATAMRMFDQSSLFRIAVQLRPGADIDRAGRRVEAVLAERHGEEDVTIITPDSILSSMTAILRVLTLVLVGIAAISLSVAGIGIMNVMLVSVSERTREIGLFKALGAAPGQILWLFLVEAALMSAAGGLLGLTLGWILVQLMLQLYPLFPTETPWWASVTALAVSVIMGVVFGVLPASRAVALDPVEALG